MLNNVQARGKKQCEYEVTMIQRHTIVKDSYPKAFLTFGKEMLKRIIASSCSEIGRHPLVRFKT